MNKYVLSLLIFCSSIAACSQQKINSLTAEAFEKGILQANIQLLDVRTVSEFNTGHLKNALQANFNNEKEFNERVQHLDKSKPVYVYCLSGVRSASALTQLQAQGFTQVYHLKGGINAWKQQNKAVQNAVVMPQLSQNDYDKAIKSDSLVLVDFGADWCPPCKKMEPIIATLLSEMPNVKLFKVDGGVNINLLQSMQVEALPVFIIYKNGKLVWRKQGIVTLEELKLNLK